MAPGLQVACKGLQELGNGCQRLEAAWDEMLASSREVAVVSREGGKRVQKEKVKRRSLLAAPRTWTQ